MNINNKKQNYSITLIADEDIRILINDIEVFNETVATGYIAIIQLDYNESKQ